MIANIINTKIKSTESDAYGREKERKIGFREKKRTTE